MPPRRTRAAIQAKQDAGITSSSKDEEQEQLSQEDTTMPEDAQPPVKKPRTAASTASPSSPSQTVPASHPVEDSIPPPPPPQDDYAPPPQEDDEPLPPPPPPPPEDHDSGDAQPESVPPPPPPPEDAPDFDDPDIIQGADYWERLAKEEENQKHTEQSRDLYLDTINRNLLDFDFEKLCSVTLSNINIYACLVCGKYYQGRGKSSNAYFHAINQGHRVYMNLEDAKVYILPDNYEVDSPSLSDIKYLLQPTYTSRQIRQLDASDAHPSFDLQGKAYWPGFVGLNNVGENDYMNVIIQALAHVTPLRNYLLSGSLRPEDSGKAAKSTSTSANAARPVASNQSLANSSELVRRFASLIRKLWNGRAFKAQVSPHEFLQEVNIVSKGSFKSMTKSDPVEFLGWLLNQLHHDLNGGSKRKPSIISQCFQGQVRVESQQVIVRTGLEDLNNIQEEAVDHEGRKESGQEDAAGNVQFNLTKEVQSTKSPFFLLAIDLPPPPIFRDVSEKIIIPQVSIAQVLSKYDGVSYQEARGMIKRYKCLTLPPYLILHFKRFTKNNFVQERNPTIVNFPIKSLNLSDIVDSQDTVSTMYNLVSNITHECTPGTVRENSIWRSQVHRDDEKWFQIQDLIVEDVNRQMIFLGESYVQIWKRRDVP
ncbi:unnamed protein product [Sympodiomycopsis kandeliae]